MKLPLLISYAYRNSIDWSVIRKASGNLDLLVDSGAFTAFKQGKPVDRLEYQNWLGNLEFRFRYFQLDVIGDPEKTYDNLVDMHSDGFEPIPIFTRGESLQRLDEYYEMSPGLVALGGVQMKSDNSPGYVKWFMGQNQNRPVHWLGFAEQSFMVALKPTSADASNWATTLMWGDILLFQQGKFHKVTRRTWPKYRSAIESLGFDSGVLTDPTAWQNTDKGNGCFAQRITAASYLHYVEQLKLRTGVTLHLVITDKREFNLLYSLYLQRSKNA